MTGNPYSSAAKASSRDKFSAMTGIKGGGHAHAGGSHMKSAGKDGEHKFWAGHEKTHDSHHRAHGGKSRPRADHRARGGAITQSPAAGSMTGRKTYAGQGANVEREARSKDSFARGGHAKKHGKGAPENVTINITQPPPPSDATTGKMPPLPPPGPGGPGAGGPPPPPMPPPGGSPPGGGGANPMAASLGKGMGFARGGRASGHRGTAKQKLEGDANYDLKHYRDYAERKKQQRAEGFVQGHTQGVDKVQKRAAGGSIHGGGSGKKSAGTMSGVGRLQDADIARSNRRANPAAFRS